MKDKGCLNANYQDIKADRVLEVDNDIAEIYAELKQALENKAIIASKSSETTFFVIRTMAAGYSLRVVYSEEENGVHSWIMAPKNVNLKG
ncbi:transcriptional initiation protein Tat [Campylobacter troglodytis]|nr:transcriptional initiation protein Tat [Campylobacter troglodytis]